MHAPHSRTVTRLQSWASVDGAGSAYHPTYPVRAEDRNEGSITAWLRSQSLEPVSTIASTVAQREESAGWQNLGDSGSGIEGGYICRRFPFFGMRHE